MKNFLTFLGGVFLLIIVLIIGLVAFMGVQLGPADQEANAYARQSIEAIAKTWNGDALYERATTGLKDNLKEGDIEALMNQGARAVGDLEELGDLTCVTRVTTTTSDGKAIMSDCTATAEHQRGTVDYRVNVEKRDGAWALNGFHFTVTKIKEDAIEI